MKSPNWTSRSEDISVNKTPFPNPNTVLVYFSIPEIGHLTIHNAFFFPKSGFMIILAYCIRTMYIPSLRMSALILLHFPYTSTIPHSGLSTGRPDHPHPTWLPSTKKCSSPVCVTRHPTVCPTWRTVRSWNLLLFFLCLMEAPHSSQWQGEESSGLDTALLGITLYSAGLIVVNPIP